MKCGVKGDGCWSIATRDRERESTFLFHTAATSASRA